MPRYLVAYGITAVVFLAIDFVWLSQVGRRFYAPRLGDLLMDRPNLAASAAFYLVYVVGVVFFAVMPALRGEAFATALLHGALFGFFAYATYDMTNYATLRNWPLPVAMLDIAWGTVLTGVSAAAGYYGTRLVTGS